VTEKIAKKCAKEFRNGDIVNLGVGIPSHIPPHVPKNI